MSTTDPHHEEHADGIVEDREKAPPIYFTVLFYGLIIWGVAFMAFYLLSGWSADAEFQAKMAAHKSEYTAQPQAAAPQAAAPQAAAPQAAAPQAAAPQAAAPQAAAPSVAAKTATDGTALFKKHCSGCHGAEGKGAFGPDLSADYKYGKTSTAAHESIALGRPGNMPAFEQKLSSEEIEALTEFILSL